MSMAWSRLSTGRSHGAGQSTGVYATHASLTWSAIAVARCSVSATTRAMACPT